MNKGQRIEQVRHALGLTQRGLAEKLGLSTRTVNRWEAGAVAPRQSMVEQIAKLGGVTVSWLLTGEGEMLGGVLTEDELALLRNGQCVDGVWPKPHPHADIGKFFPGSYDLVWVRQR